MARGKPFPKGNKAAKGKGPKQKKREQEQIKPPASDGTRRGRPKNEEVLSLLTFLDQQTAELDGVSPRQEARKQMLKLLKAGDKDIVRMVWVYCEGPAPKGDTNQQQTITVKYEEIPTPTA